MSLEAKMEALGAEVAKTTAQLGELIAALQGNTAIMTALNDGRQQAIETLTAKDAEAPKPATRGRKKAEQAPAEEPEETTAVTGWNPDISVEGMRKIATDYLTGTSDETEKNARVANFKAILTEVGADALNPTEGKKHVESDDDRRRVAFYVSRHIAGLPVDFGADYDFTADPLTQTPEPAASDDDLVG